ncbi:glycoside hydrolase family 73 protein [Paenibacillus gansuensis]|uniref:Glycoside hydrolase family 73 protein n=1 Tax=Paenibacillus gansuensis TaxID=306542 RepID=A0ABW5PDW1_9BACL
MAARQQEFIDTVAPIAVKLRLEGSPIFPSVRIAQALLETGATLHSWNNLVGYKAGRGKPTPYWDGSTISTKTWEVYNGIRHDNVTANFRVYNTIEDGFRDQDLLFQIPRYEGVRAAETPVAQTQALYAAGYATDPNYPAKLQNLIAIYGLTQYDEEVDRVLEELKATIEALSARIEKLEASETVPEVPVWAKPSVAKALKTKLISSEEGSLTFYRLLTVLDRKGLL